MEKSGEAIAYYRKAVLINPEDDQSLYRLGFLLAEKKEYKESIKQLERSLEIAKKKEVRDLLNRVYSLHYNEEGNDLLAKMIERARYRSPVSDLRLLLEEGEA